MQWQQGMQQQGNHTAGVGKETRRQNKSKFGLCSDSSGLHLLIRFSELRWEMGQSLERRDAKYRRDDCLSQDRASAYMMCFGNPYALFIIKGNTTKHEAAGPTAVNGDPYSLSRIDPREHCCSCAIGLVSHWSFQNSFSLILFSASHCIKYSLIYSLTAFRIITVIYICI